MKGVSIYEHLEWRGYRWIKTMIAWLESGGRSAVYKMEKLRTWMGINTLQWAVMNRATRSQCLPADIHVRKNNTALLPITTRQWIIHQAQLFQLLMSLCPPSCNQSSGGTCKSVSSWLIKIYHKFKHIYLWVAITITLKGLVVTK